jgi:hypothetical protein
LGEPLSPAAVSSQLSAVHFKKKKGYIGLAPEYAVPGDMMCMIFGAMVPFVLRKAPEKWFELAGETYVYGIMMEKQWI